MQGRNDSKYGITLNSNLNPLLMDFQGSCQVSRGSRSSLTQRTRLNSFYLRIYQKSNLFQNFEFLLERTPYVMIHVFMVLK